MTPDGRSHRAFFALWPEPAAARAIATAYPVPGRRTHPDDLHLTLVFLGSVADPDLPALARLAADLARSPFELTLGGLEHWTPARAWVALVRDAPVALGLLRTELLRRLATTRLAAGRPDEADFRPHVTLSRAGVQDAREMVDPPLVAWRAAAVTLAVTQPLAGGARYRRLATLPFAAC